MKHVGILICGNKHPGAVAKKHQGVFSYFSLKLNVTCEWYSQVPFKNSPTNTKQTPICEWDSRVGILSYLLKNKYIFIIIFLLRYTLVKILFVVGLCKLTCLQEKFYGQTFVVTESTMNPLFLIIPNIFVTTNSVTLSCASDDNHLALVLQIVWESTQYYDLACKVENSCWRDKIVGQGIFFFVTNWSSDLNQLNFNMNSYLFESKLENGLSQIKLN